ncbi:hypothetical protein [Metamycoplasma equirhinis]|uniref:hypothetical protein n=1 Tax=Metamycoplasma equirhinis TaxID=92402 RepID=UPI003592EF74
MERLFELGGSDKKWALIFGIQCFNTQNFINNLSKFKHPELVFTNKRMKFSQDLINNKIESKAQPPFQSIWICNNLFSNQINFWIGEKCLEK